MRNYPEVKVVKRMRTSWISGSPGASAGSDIRRMSPSERLSSEMGSSRMGSSKMCPSYMWSSM